MTNDAQQPAADTDSESRAVIDFRKVAGDLKEIVIVYEGREYRLIETKNRKLILNR